MSAFSLRHYDAARDEEPAIALWLDTGRRPIRKSISPDGLTGGASTGAETLVPTARIVVAEAQKEMIGFVTVDLRTHYLDQLVVAPEYWGIGVGTRLIAEAKRLSPAGLNLDVNTDNARAIAFYRKGRLCYYRRRL